MSLNICVKNNIDSYIVSFLPNALRSSAKYALNTIPYAKETITWAIGEQLEQLGHIRAEYREKVSKIKDLYDQKISSGATIDEAFARELFELRNEVKNYEREQTPWVGQIGIFIRNPYDWMWGSSFEDKVKAGKSYSQIAESAGRTGGFDLGLESDMFMCLINKVATQHIEQTSTNDNHDTSVMGNLMELDQQN